ncbi:hypothetical protein Vretimale_16374 [Volvox reticuliferus]|uniref:Uncharacterized protein n=1 Tax=Volvox reticuliferus TaxID=1737510 RepID=A0A8J4GTF1_9CHLO|nr:hypothetical protein Vretimale_16374 [Volvox reticuliferus]
MLGLSTKAQHNATTPIAFIEQHAVPVSSSQLTLQFFKFRSLPLQHSCVRQDFIHNGVVQNAFGVTREAEHDVTFLTVAPGWRHGTDDGCLCVTAQGRLQYVNFEILRDQPLWTG